MEQAQKPNMIQMQPDAVSAHYPWRFRTRLVEAAERRDVRLIDHITDEMVSHGLCRPRCEDRSSQRKVVCNDIR